MRQMTRISIGTVAIAIGLSASAQQQPDASRKPSVPEILALVDCEDAAYGKQGGDTKIRFGFHDAVHRQWLITGGKRDEVISCLVQKHGWTAIGAPDGRRGARAPR